MLWNKITVLIVKLWLCFTTVKHKHLLETHKTSHVGGNFRWAIKGGKPFYFILPFFMDHWHVWGSNIQRLFTTSWNVLIKVCGLIGTRTYRTFSTTHARRPRSKLLSHELAAIAIVLFLYCVVTNGSIGSKLNTKAPNALAFSNRPTLIVGNKATGS